MFASAEVLEVEKKTASAARKTLGRCSGRMLVTWHGPRPTTRALPSRRRPPPSRRACSGRPTASGWRPRTASRAATAARGPHHWYALLFLMRTLEVAAEAHAPVREGRAQRLGHRRPRGWTSTLPRLPAAFDGFTVLHLSDLHLDGMPGLEERSSSGWARTEFDLCVLTGDYRTELHGPIRPTMDRLRPLVSRRAQPARGARRPRQPRRLPHGRAHGGHGHPGARQREREAHARDGTSCRSSARTTSTTTSPTRRCTRSRRHATRSRSRSCTRRRPSTSPPQLGVDLYLCGHTHAGQVCLPGGRPVITHLSRGRRFYRGTWRHRGMVGVTNAGAGTSGVPRPVQHARRSAGADAPLRPARVAARARFAGLSRARAGGVCSASCCRPA